MNKRLFTPTEVRRTQRRWEASRDHLTKTPENVELVSVIYQLVVLVNEEMVTGFRSTLFIGQFVLGTC